MSRIDDALRRIAQLRRTGGTNTSHEPGRLAPPTAVTLEAYAGEDGAAPIELLHRHVERSRPTPRVAAEPLARVAPDRAAEPSPSLQAETPETPVDDGALIDVGLITDYALFVLGSLRRHKFIAASTFLLVAGLSGAAARFWPRTYEAEARLIVQRSDVMAALSNPGRSIPRDTESPARNAAAMVLSRESLTSLVKQTNMLAQWQQRRPPLLRLKDTVMYRIRGVPTEAERLEGMIGLLEQRLTVSPGMEDTLRIAVTWPDRQLAYEIVETALQNFLDNKRVAESSAISESVTILERYVAAKQTEVNNTFTELQTEIANRPKPAVRRVVQAPVKPTSPAPTAAAAPRSPTNSSFGIVAPEKAARLARVKNAIEARRTEIARLDDARARQLSDVQGRLAAAQTIYTEDHPTVSSLRQNLASLSVDPPQLVALRAEVQALEREQDQLLTESDRPATPQVSGGEAKPVEGDPPAAVAAAASRFVDTAPVASHPELAAFGVGSSDYTSPTSLRLRLELAQLGEIRERLESARIELSTSQAGFKYRYGIFRPTQMPRRPLKPNILMIVIAGVIAALGLAIFAAVAADVIRGRVVEPWQVDRLVGVPVVLRLRTL